MRRSAPLIPVVGLLAACSFVGTGNTLAPAGATPSPTAIVTPGPTAAASAEALAACSALVDDVPSTRLNSGVASVAGAYEITGDQLGNYFDRLHGASSTDDASSTFHDKGTKRLTMCLFDGDFTSMTPGPSGHDTTVPRVLIVIEDGVADLWAIALDEASQLPAIDPATIQI